ncbi:hypothetical protein H5T54_04665 [Candidatus Bipolaricaulota bacterium]|nr:hypothetical protein [Candidatus Bipolaricaulota bacterium]
MRRFAGALVPARLRGWGVGSLLVAAAAWCIAGGEARAASIWLGGEVGWEGLAVVGEVNPLQVTVENGTSIPLTGTLVAVQRVGSGWRGQATQRLEAPVVLAPGGRVQFVFPWPVEAGSEPVTILVERDGVALARATVPVRPTVEKPVAIVGAGVGDLGSGPVVFLAPEELPDDPLLLSALSRVRIAPGATVSARPEAALRAWAAYGGGEVDGLPVAATASSPSDADLRAALRLHAPRPPPVGPLLGGTSLYLLLLGFALPALSRRGGAPRAALLLALSLSFSLVYPVLYDSPQNITAVQYTLTSSSDMWFCLDTLVVVPRRGGVWEVAGWWVERVPAGEERVVAAVEWFWGGEGPRTRISLGAGQAAILWRYGPAWVEGGEEVVVGPEGTVGVHAGFAPLVAAIRAAEGDRLFVDWAEERRGEVAFSAYRLRWEQRD